MPGNDGLSKVLPVATVAVTPDLDPQITRERMRSMIEETKREHPDVRLILFGETILGWFYKKGETRAYHESIAETVPGTSTQFVAALAKHHDIYISFGLSEFADSKLYNTQVLISPTGDIIAKHRKFWIRNKIFAPGSRRLTTADIDGVKVALLICADARSLKLMRAIRREHVDLVLASLADYGTSRRLNQLMGAAYDAWTLVANRYGEEPPIMWHGLISITDPWARLHAFGMGREQILARQLEIGNLNSLRQSLRRALMGFKFIGLSIILTIQMVWQFVRKKNRN